MSNISEQPSIHKHTPISERVRRPGLRSPRPKVDFLDNCWVLGHRVRVRNFGVLARVRDEQPHLGGGVFLMLCSGRYISV